ncbi:MAG TPA: M50 family metallopeptidase [Gemmataceae bacterium]|nr:M50 family metallopeptidase [Gemmataceae bacterium]
MKPGTTERLPGGTPILDRETPLPESSVPGPGSRVMLGVFAGLCVGIAALLVLWQPPFVESLHQWILTQVEELFPGSWTFGRLLSVGLFSVLIGFSITAIHELGHLIVGVCVGFRCSSMFLGPLQLNAPFRISLNPDVRSWWHGGVRLVPGDPNEFRARAVAMVFAGPGANLLTGCAVLLLPFPRGFFSWLFVVVSIVAGVAELVLPLRGATFVHDGRRIWMLLRDRARGGRWLALMRLIADTRAGVLPESMPAALLARATAVRDDSADTVTAHAFAYSAAFHQHRDDEAARRLETCLAHSGHAPPVVREALMSDAAVFQARRRKRVDLADQWLAAMPARTQHRWFRSRAEAAILEAKGDTAGALDKLTEVEAAIRTLPASAQRETLLRLLARWKSELGGS